MKRTLSIALAAVMLASAAAPAFAASAKERRAFRKADVNRDKVLNRSEFRSFVILMARQRNKLARKVVANGPAGFGVAWSRVNRNNDGVVTPAELRRF